MFFMRKAGQVRQIQLHSEKMAEFGSELYFRVAFISLLLASASGDCVDLDLGMENGIILDSKITASSQQNVNTPAKNGRLNYTSGSSWCAGTSDSNPYLQIDLQTLHIICAVSTQGNSQANQWVKNYTLKLSKDGSTWTDYKEGGLVKTLEGNNDRNSEVKHVLYGVLTRYLRFLPKTHQGRVCMRTELFGVKKKPENLALGKTATQSSTFQTSGAGKAVDGNSDTDHNNGHCSHTNENSPSWWRVDLGSDYVPVSEIYIVNRFSSSTILQQRNKDYKITLGTSPTVTGNPACEGLYSFLDFKASAVCFINPLITGRYVGIMTTKKQYLQLCEVEIYSRENLAFGKPTDQYEGRYKDGKSSKAVDGNSNTDFKAGKSEGSCTMTYKSSLVAPWWRVDLQQVERVSEVYMVNRGSECGFPKRFKNFEIRVGSQSSGASLANPKCGDTYTYRFPAGEGKSFFCHPTLKGKFVIIRFVDKGEPLTLCEVEVYSERKACPMQAIGLASSDAFPDDCFSASSTRTGYEAFNGRLYGAGSWSPTTKNDASDYLQIDLIYEFVICAVATQGNPTADHWTTKYNLRMSLIGGDNNWLTYQENSTDKVFNGNSGKNDIVKHSLKDYASARFIRFQPTAYSGHKALRVEVFGVLISAVPSQPPSGFTVAAITSTSVKASWQLPPENGRHGIITGFKLFYGKKDSVKSPTVLTNNITSLARIISGLVKYTEYEFQVLAFSSKGDGPNSSVVVERTKEDVPSGPPENLYVTAVTSTSVTASWDLPPEDERNGVVTGFKLFYKKKDSVGTSKVLNIKSQGSVIRVITGLNKYTVYEFQMLAYTSVGDGPKSSVIFEITKEDAPSAAPSGLNLMAKTSTSITASWQLPPADSRNGIITGFKLFYKEKGSVGSQTMVPVNSGSTRTRVVSGLNEYTEYEFQVLAYTSVGDGPKSSVKSERTKEDAPSKAPSSFFVTAKTSTSIQASWQLPPADDRNGIITGFKLFYKKKGSAGSPTVERINSGSTLTKVVTGLAKYTEYEFKVLAFTSKGDGPISNPQSAKTKEDAPSKAPTSFTVTTETSTSITASWQLPPADSRNGVISGFKLFYKKKGSSGSQTVERINSGSTLTKLVTGLDKYTEYQFQVLAYTSAGEGPKSSVKSGRTGEDAPSAAPGGFTVNAKTSTSITASWQLPPKSAWNGIIKGFKLFYKKKGPSGSQTMELINDKAVLTTDVIGLAKYTDYEFQVLAFTSKGDGPNTTVQSETTREDAPGNPSTLTTDVLDPDMSHGPRIKLNWTIPAEPNGVIRSYTLYYSHSGNTQKETFAKDTLSYSVDVLGGIQYQFHVRAVTIKPGPNASSTVNVPEYRPSIGPANVSFRSFNKTTFNISWAPLTREESYGKVILYDVKGDLLSRVKHRKRSLGNSITLNTTATFVVLYDLSLCSQYNVFVRAYTKAGPGPYTQPMVLQTSKTEAPSDLRETNSGSTEVTLKWTKPKVKTKEGLSYTVKYSGTKYYNDKFEHRGTKAAGKSTTCKVDGLVPGSSYKFEVYGTSVCGKSLPIDLKVETKMAAPIAPVVLNVTDVTVTETVAEIHLWPVEQRNGPISAYQVIVLKFVDGAKKLPDDYDSKLNDANNTNKENLNFYIAAEIPNDPVYEESWKFTVGDDTTHGGFVNRALERGEEYVIFQRAVTRDNGGILAGVPSRVAKISTRLSEVPPRIAKQVSPSSVTCEMETLCTLFCHATSDNPFNYSWTKNGQILVSDDIKIMNNIIVLTPRDAEDYGVYVCHATNSFGSTAYQITLLKGHKSSALADVKRTFNTTVICFSCILFVSLVIIGVLIWQLRRALPTNRATTAGKVITDSVGKPDSPRDQHMSEPGSYMELHPRPLEGQSHAPPEYKGLQGRDQNIEYYNVGFSKQGSGQKRGSPHDQRVSEPAVYMELQPRPSEGRSHAPSEYKSLQGRKKNTEYYNVGFNKGNKRDQQEEIYDEVGNAQC